jgi:molybdopterin-guanine dinucleotide biosynthesis protein A
MIKDITGIILCGGKSSRMQSNKALLKFGNETVIEIILGEMKKVFDEVILSASDSDDFSFLNIMLVKDFQPNCGPLGGIYSALNESKTERNFITTCDLPMINNYMIEYISNAKSRYEIIIPSISGIPQRLFGIYNKSVTNQIEEIFSLSENDDSIKGSVFELHERVSVKLIEIEHLSFYNKNMFINMNTPEDYEYLKNIIEKK